MPQVADPSSAKVAPAFGPPERESIPPQAPLISVVIPLAPGESAWAGLLSDLAPIPENWEVVLAASESAPAGFVSRENLRWRRCERHGRAAQMNEAARNSQADFLWFAHADARFAPEAKARLEESVRAWPSALHYFPLRFRDGGARMRINEWGARMRCAIFRNPWGDQSLCVSRRVFEAVGGFPEDAPHGEDNLFALRARRRGVLLRRVDARATTSARGYGGGAAQWLGTTARYQRLWIRQAVGEWLSPGK